MCATEESGQARHRHSCCVPSINADDAAFFLHVGALFGHAVASTLLLSLWEAAASIGAVQGSLPHWPPLLFGAPIQFVNARTNSVLPLHISEALCGAGGPRVPVLPPHSPAAALSAAAAG